MVGQVQEVNGQKVITPISGVTAVDAVQSGNLNAVTGNAVASALSYSTTEQLTGGTWIDGKPIYRKTVDCGTLPNATSKNVAHNIANLGQIVSIKGITKRTTDFFNIPHVSPQGISYSINVSINFTNIVLATGVNRTDFTDTKVTLEYTKTTDTATRSIPSETRNIEETRKGGEEEIKDDEPIEEPKEEEKK